MNATRVSLILPRQVLFSAYLFIHLDFFSRFFLCVSSGARRQPRLTGDFKDVSALFILFFFAPSEILTGVDSQMIVDVFR